MGLLKKIFMALAKTRKAFKAKIDHLFEKNQLDKDFFEKLEEILIMSDIGAETSEELVKELKTQAKQNKIKTTEQAKQIFKHILVNALSFESIEFTSPAIILIVGVNGVGKTTTIGKLAHFFKNQGKSVALVAGDTFRAGATQQLFEWAKQNKVRIIKQDAGADASAIVFDGISSAKAKKLDVLLIDTAGRLHTKKNLMQELSKIDRIITRENTYGAKKFVLMVLDGTIGQNAISQIKHFQEFINIDGIVLTKLDGTAKGGIVFSVAKEFGLPIVFVGVGEHLGDIEPFNAKDFVDNLF